MNDKKISKNMSKLEKNNINEELEEQSSESEEETQPPVNAVKKVRTQAQMEAFKKAQAKRHEQLKIIRERKEKEKQEFEAVKAEIKAKKQEKKKKKEIKKIIEESSSDESDDEVEEVKPVIKKKSKKKEPINIVINNTLPSPPEPSQHKTGLRTAPARNLVFL